MKKITAIVVAFAFVLGFAALGFTAEDKCRSCHKGDKALDKIVAKKNIKNAADFMKAVEEGPLPRCMESLVTMTSKQRRSLKLQ
jgi:hypothetical protein